MSDYTASLHDKHVCRVFFSSPFNGMKAEREILASRYWPRLQSYCESRGVHFRAVDLRWGITQEAAENAQVINICLNEINRSDIFVGFYGQRYGWSGINDAVLQSNFNTVALQYPWIHTYRDRSVTELEFLHGFLNNPKQKPACVCFRSKSYDDKQRQRHADANDSRTASHYTVENKIAAQRLDDLKQRCQITKPSLGVLVDYKTPEEGAEYMFLCIWKHITTHLLINTYEKETVSERKELLMPHEAFLSSRSSVYVGCVGNLNKLDMLVREDNALPILITGTSGIGKSAMLSTWISRKRKCNKLTHFIYHFIGCTEDSALLSNVLKRLILELNYALCNEHPSLHIEGEEEFTKLTINRLAKEVHALLKKCATSDQQFVIVIDGIDKIRNSKLRRPVYWLPKDTGGNVTIIVATTLSDVQTIEELCDAHECPRLEMDYMSLEDKLNLCDTLLKENSKVLESDKINMICSQESTNNPLFLRIVLDELCIYGSFRSLEDQISNLIGCKAVQELFSKYVDRLDADFSAISSRLNIVRDTLCALVYSKVGLSEDDLIEMFDLQLSQWAPLYFAIQRYLIMRSGKLSYAHKELTNAIKEKYVTSEQDMRAIVMQMANYFEQKYRLACKNTESISETVVVELARLLQISNQKVRLQQLICDEKVFQFFYRSKLYDLIELIRFLNVNSIVFAKRFLTGIDCSLSDQYNSKLNSYDSNISTEETHINAYISLALVFSHCKFHAAEQIVWKRILRIYQNSKLFTADKLLSNQAYVHYKLACIYSEREEFKRSISLHKIVIRQRDKLCSKNSSECTTEQLATSYHGIAIAYAGDEQHETAIQYFRMAINIHVSLNTQDVYHISKALNNIGNILIQLKRYNEAMRELEAAMELENKYYFGVLPPSASYTMHNIGLCYRNLNNLEMAEKWYVRSLNVKVRTLGWDDPDVAISHMNIGTLNLHKKNYGKAEEHYRKCLAIYQKYYNNDTLRMVMVLENLANVLCLMSRYKEAEPFYQPALERLIRSEKMDKCLPELHQKFANWYETKGQLRQACMIWEALAGRSNASDEDYTNLWEFYDNIPKEMSDTIQQKEQFSLERAVQRWPFGDHIVAYRIEAAMEIQNFVLIEELLTSYIREVEGFQDLCTSVLEALITEGYSPQAKAIVNNIKKELSEHKGISILMKFL